MIQLGTRLYPLASPSPSSFVNTVLVCPWTGHVWGKIDRGCRQWSAMHLEPEGSYPDARISSIPGSLYTNYQIRLDNALQELPRVLLDRELRVLEGFTSRQLSGYNPHTIPQSESAMQSAALLQEIATLRAKCADGSITDDELRRAIQVLREDRVTAGTRAAAKATRAAPINPDDALAAFLS